MGAHHLHYAILPMVCPGHRIAAQHRLAFSFCRAKIQELPQFQFFPGPASDQVGMPIGISRSGRTLITDPICAVASFHAGAVSYHNTPDRFRDNRERFWDKRRQR